MYSTSTCRADSGAANIPFQSLSHASAGQIDRSFMLARMAQLSGENTEAGVALERATRHLSCLLEMASNADAPTDSDAFISQVCWKLMMQLAAGAVYVFDAAGSGRCAARASSARVDDVPDPSIVHAQLAQSLAQVKRTGDTTAAVIYASDGSPCANRRALLGAVRKTDASVMLIVVWPSNDSRTFHETDRQVLHAVLTHCSEALSRPAPADDNARRATEILAALNAAMRLRDPDAAGHAERVAWLSVRLGERIGLGASELQEIEWAGLAHDLGKFGIAEAILNKPDTLTEAEAAAVHHHAACGEEIVAQIAVLKPLAPLVRHHHENYDGGGYPDGLAEDAIPLAARILRIADTFDAITSTRSYRAGLPLDVAIDELIAGAGRATDPYLTSVFVELVRGWISRSDAEFRKRFAHIGGCGWRRESAALADSTAST